jgi:hypothetical protein
MELLISYKRAAKNKKKDPKPGCCWMCRIAKLKTERKTDVKTGLCSGCYNNILWGVKQARLGCYLKEEHLQMLTDQYVLEGYVKLPARRWFCDDLVALSKQIYTPEQLLKLRNDEAVAFEKQQKEEQERRRQINDMGDERNADFPTPDYLEYNFPALNTYILMGYVPSLAQKWGISDDESLQEYVKWAVYKTRRMEKRRRKIVANLELHNYPVAQRWRLMNVYIDNGLAAAAKFDSRVTTYDDLVQLVVYGELEK